MDVKGTMDTKGFASFVSFVDFVGAGNRSEREGDDETAQRVANRRRHPLHANKNCLPGAASTTHLLRSALTGGESQHFPQFIVKTGLRHVLTP